MYIIYHYYTENFDHSKHKPFLTEQQFFPLLQMHSDVNQIYIKVCNYYDKHYNVVTILDSEGNIICFS